MSTGKCKVCPPIDDRCACPRGMRHHALNCDRHPGYHPAGVAARHDIWDDIKRGAYQRKVAEMRSRDT